MSYVTDVIVYVSGFDAEDFINELKAPYDPSDEEPIENYRCIELKEVSMDGAGGPKGFMRTVLAGAGNYLPMDKYFLHLKSIAEQHRRPLVAIIAPEQQSPIVLNYSPNAWNY